MIVGIILAAGESKRMGTPKQLLPWGKKIILQQVIDNAEAARLDKILLILGSNADDIKTKINISPKTTIVINENYKEGMSSSVICGVKNAPAKADAYLLLLGDQPFTSTEIINKVIDCYLSSKSGIVRPIYQGKHGHPIIFNVKYKQELLSIAEGGAKIVLTNHLNDLFELPLAAPEILNDIDTPEDYRQALDQNKPE